VLCLCVLCVACCVLCVVCWCVGVLVCCVVYLNVKVPEVGATVTVIVPAGVSRHCRGVDEKTASIATMDVN
jgi:hypothetical protein